MKQEVQKAEKIYDLRYCLIAPKATIGVWLAASSSLGEACKYEVTACCVCTGVVELSYDAFYILYCPLFYHCVHTLVFFFSKVCLAFV